MSEKDKNSNRRPSWRASYYQEILNKRSSKERDNFQCLACGKRLVAIKTTDNGIISQCIDCVNDSDKILQEDPSLLTDTHRKHGFGCTKCSFKLQSHHTLKSPWEVLDRESLQFISDTKIEASNNRYAKMVEKAEEKGVSLNDYLHQIARSSPDGYDDCDMLITLCEDCHHEYHGEVNRRIGTHQEILSIFQQVTIPLLQADDLPEWMSDREGKLEELADRGYLSRVEIQESDSPIYVLPDRIGGGTGKVIEDKVSIQDGMIVLDGVMLRKGGVWSLLGDPKYK